MQECSHKIIFFGGEVLPFGVAWNLVVFSFHLGFYNSNGLMRGGVKLPPKYACTCVRTIFPGSLRLHLVFTVLLLNLCGDTSLGVAFEEFLCFLDTHCSTRGASRKS